MFQKKIWIFFFPAVASISLKVVQRDLTARWLFTSTFPTPLTDGTFPAHPLQRLAGC